MRRPLLLAVSHGTADAAGARAIADLVDAVALALPDVEVRSAFVDVQRPDAADVMPTLEGPVVIVPLLLSHGFHVDHDLHGMAATRADAVVAAPLGPDPRLAEVLTHRLEGALAAAPPTASGSRRPVVLAVAGSRDPVSLIDAVDMAALLTERLGHPVELAYLAARFPDLPTALQSHPDAVVSTYLLAQGYFFDLARRQSSTPISPPLLDGGAVPAALVDLVVQRYADAAARLGAERHPLAEAQPG